MKRFTVSHARERLADLLDAAESGETVVIERRGVLFGLQATLPAAAKRTRTASVIEYVDPAVADGEWTWNWGAKGLTFKSGRRRTRLSRS